MTRNNDASVLNDVWITVKDAALRPTAFQSAVVNNLLYYDRSRYRDIPEQPEPPNSYAVLVEQEGLLL